MTKTELFREAEAARRAFIEAVKEAGRLAVVAAVSVFVKVLMDSFAPMADSNLVASIVFIVLKALDKWLHKYNKEVREVRGVSQGLIPF